MKRRLIIVGVLLAVLLSFLVSDGFRQVVSRRRAIRETQEELRRTEAEIELARARLRRLQSDSSAYEQLVREELGYLRPGEKEARILKK